MIKTFRGRLENDTTATIRLATNTGMKGYRIKKFQALPTSGSKDIEGVLKLYSVENDEVSTPSTDINFDDPLLLAAGIVSDGHSHEIGWSSAIVFDNVTFNQDIFITWKCHDKVEEINYYIELEQTNLDLSEATVATLKDMRGSN